MECVEQIERRRLPNEIRASILVAYEWERGNVTIGHKFLCNWEANMMADGMD